MSCAYQRALNLSDATLFRKERYYGKRLPYHPDWMSALNLKYKLTGRIAVLWKSDYESRLYRGPSNLEQEILEERIRHDIELRYAFSDFIDVRFECTNLSDNDVPDRWGYPKPGRAFHVTLKWNYEKGK